ncbi:transcriptional regulator [Candidatus Kaiserbacteria bacterium RIFCSPLOWO2_01_FULL_54_22]|nr:MAG: transcriptional regulator [Candidatus Kaiserbacteria bacterium RIFCSPLOWO2_01_FULL_54_22]
MNISVKFGKRLRTIRLKKGMSQGDVAKRLEVHRTYISKIERGIQNLSLKGMEKLAKAIGISVGELIK